jgi:hypothetical protein
MITYPIADALRLCYTGAASQPAVRGQAGRWWRGVVATPGQERWPARTPVAHERPGSKVRAG